MLLFAYGTLQPDRAPAEIRPWVSQFSLVGEGTVRGRIHQFDDYPGVKLTRTGSEIRGKVFQLPDDEKLLSALDAYEEYDPARADNLFRRKPTVVTLADGTKRTAWIYEYGKPLPRASSVRHTAPAPPKTKQRARAVRKTA